MGFFIAKMLQMAKDKKGFILYSDLIHTINKLSDEQAGKLFKHILEYVNDNNPESDQFTEVVFEPIKQTLKRDLQKYEGICKRNSENARKRWDATASDRIPNDAKNADKEKDKDKDKVISKDIYRSFAHLSISNADVEKLLDKYSITEIDEVLDAIQNYKGNKNYTSLYLTANKWLSKNKKTTEIEEPRELQILRQYAKKQG
jgi:hypothetical protein